MLKSLIRGKFIGSRSVNNPPEHFVNNQVLTVGIRPYADGRFLPLNLARPMLLGVPSTPAAAAAPSPSRRGQGLHSFRSMKTIRKEEKQHEIRFHIDH